MFRTVFTVMALVLSGPALAQSEPVGDRVAVNGMQMYYEVSGAGDPLIVLHGAYMNIPAMGEIVPKLAETHKVYAIEMQGHGRTTDIDRPVTYENLADDVAAFMDAVGIGKADLFGYSMGGGAALQFAIRHPERLDHLVVASAGFDEDGLQPAYKAMIPQMNRDMFAGSPMEAAWRQYAPDPDGFPAFVDRMIALEHEPIHWEAGVKGIESPVLVIAGDADVITLEHAVALFRLLGGGVMGDMGEPLSNARLAILPATSHTAVIGQTDLLYGVMEPFLTDRHPKGMFD